MRTVVQFPKAIAKARRSRTIQHKLRQHKLSSFINNAPKRRRKTKPNISIIKAKKLEVINLKKSDCPVYYSHNWDNLTDEVIPPPIKEGISIDISSFTEIYPTDAKSKFVEDADSGEFIVGIVTRDIAKQLFGGQEYYKECRSLVQLMQECKPSISRGDKNSGVNTNYNLSGHRQDPLLSGTLGEYVFNAGTSAEIKNQVNNGVSDMVRRMEQAGKRIVQKLAETDHFRSIQKKLRLETVRNDDKGISTQYASGENYWSQSHLDDDFFFTHLSCLSKEAEDSEKFIYYFVFPEYRLRIPLKTGDVIVFNPLKVHSCSNCRVSDSHIFSAYVTKKTVMTAAIRAGLDK